MKTEIVEIKAYTYKGRRFWSLEELNKFKENEFIESLECLTYDRDADSSCARDVLLLLLEHNITSKKQIKYFLDKVL